MVIDSSVLGHGMILGIQSRPGQLDTVILYNNYVYAGGHLNAGGDPYINGIVLRWYGYVNSVYPLTYVINNTIVTSNGGENTILQEYGGMFYNNIICQFGTNGEDPANYGGLGLEAFASSWGLDQTYVDSVRSNLMWNEWTDDMTFGGNRFVGSGGNPIGAPSNWAEWTNSSWGGTGINANPLFVNNVRKPNGFVLSSNSPAINAGENLQEFIESKGLPWTDIEGKTRDSSPDIGAYEYDGLLGVENELQPLTYNLEQNYPNPFNPSTTISYSIPASSFVTLKVFDILGNEISSLVNEEMSAGNYEVEFNAVNLPSGVYFYRLQTANFVETRKMVLMK
jgi:hypothetical protein